MLFRSLNRLKKLRKLVKNLKATEEVNRRQISKLEHDKSDLLDKNARLRSNNYNQNDMTKIQRNMNHYVVDETDRKNSKNKDQTLERQSSRVTQNSIDKFSSSKLPVLDNRISEQNNATTIAEEKACLANIKKQSMPLPAIPSEDTTNEDSKTLKKKLQNKKRLETPEQDIESVDLKNLEDTVFNIAIKRKGAEKISRNRDRCSVSVSEDESEILFEDKVKTKEQKIKEDLRKRLASMIARDFDIGNQKMLNVDNSCNNKDDEDCNSLKLKNRSADNE